MGARHAVACANGTAALHLAMMALDVKPGEVVIAPSDHLPGDRQLRPLRRRRRGVRRRGSRHRADDAADTLAEAIGRVGDRRLRAVLPVHLRGDAAELPALAELAASARARCWSRMRRTPWARPCGSATWPRAVGDVRHSAMATFSFHPVKTIATGEGGMVTTNDPALAERLRALRSHGMVRPAGAEPWWYEMPEPGFNYRLPDILCALGLSQLEEAAALRRAAARAGGRLSPRRWPRSRRWCARRPGRRGAIPVLHLMTVLIDFEAAGRLAARGGEALKARGVGSQVHYIPVHRQPYYRELYGDAGPAGRGRLVRPLPVAAALSGHGRTATWRTVVGGAEGRPGPLVAFRVGVAGGRAPSPPAPPAALDRGRGTWLPSASSRRDWPAAARVLVHLEAACSGLGFAGAVGRRGPGARSRRPPA